MAAERALEHGDGDAAVAAMVEHLNGTTRAVAWLRSPDPVLGFSWC
jgi:DNA-binding GntR family transcriptional regulator